MKTIVPLLLSIVFFIISCSPTSNNTFDKKMYYIPYIEIDNSISSDKIFQTISCVPLVTNDSCLLGSIQRIMYKNNKYYIQSNNCVYIFEENGGILRIINKHGTGPEEYNFFWIMTVNDKGHISLIQRGDNSIITYNSQGDFVSKLRLDTIKMRDIKYLNDSILIAKCDFEHTGNKYYVINMNKLTLEKSFYPISYRKCRVFMEDCMTSYQGKILTCDYHSNEIHEINQDSACIRYLFNIDGKMPPKGYWDNNNVDIQTLDRDYAQKGYIGDITCFAENDKAILFRFHGKKENTEAFTYIDKLTGENYIFNTIEIANDLSISPSFFYAQDDGKLIFIIEAHTILESKNESVKAKYPDLEEDSNPVLLYVELN